MTDQTRKCMFCGERASSKEDAWPLWLVRMFPISSGVEVEAHRKDAEPTSWRQRGHFAKAKFACRACNNGWMSSLENQAKPSIQALLFDTRSTLDPADRETVARWVMKTAMVFEAVGGRGWFYSSEERSTLRSGRIPTGYTAFWAAKCANLPGAYSAANNMFENAHLLTAGVHGHVTTLAIGTVAFQVLTVRPSYAVPVNAAIRIDGANSEPWPRTAYQLWPPTVEFEWPPAIALNGELGVENFANRFRQPEIPPKAGLHGRKTE